MMTLSKAALALAAAWALLPAAQAQGTGYPSKPVKLVVGYAPGGATDIGARLIADALGKDLGQSFIVENRPGANSNIGAEYVVRAPADGYTLFVGSISTAINQGLYTKLGFDAGKDLVPVAQLNVVPNILAVSAKLPVNSVAEYIAYGKQHPDKLTCASPGSGSSAHLGCELFKLKTGTSILHVPYRGSGPAVSDLLGGQVDSMMDNLPPLLAQIRAGKLKGLAVTTAARVDFASDIPTVAESGVPGFEVAAWFGVFAPAGTPAQVVETVNKAINRALNANPDVRAKYQSNGFMLPPAPNSSASFQRFFNSEIKRWAEVAQATHLKID
ncbi:tripartite tricarboxylate transporter substrate binding protein [Comamonas koreensis]|uniref:Tripartite tricarboxylate transporter substrate binding protein n=1 Tax=Comamonas koreensis TaxID=160825 RepID=A0AAW4XTG2_9BURK|nr:tripartite tricarboxylate transporter substrate binding protein [Comamonas koreensis]MCD2164358.1 tripartite tricarboxylate transporter substrate binding protein [Comamonas koreensis]